jgi:putative methylase
VDAALAHGRTVYSLFNAGTLPFLERYLAGRGEIVETISARLVLPRSMAHHRKETVEIPVECLRIRSLLV